MELTWDELRDTKVGTILHDEFHDEFKEGVRFIVMRGPASLCAYLGIPIDHPLANRSYDDLDIECHGGLTFGQAGDGKQFPKGYYWYGWDYAHCDDYSFYLDLPVLKDVFKNNHLKEKKKKWNVADVVADSWLPIYRMQNLMKLAKSIYNDARKDLA